MRVIASTVLTAVAAVLYTGSTFASSSSSSAASIYTFTNRHNGHHDTPVSLSEEETRLVFASRLGLARFHSISGNVNAFKLENNQKSLWVDEYEREGSIVVSIGGVADTRVFSNIHPKYYVDDAPSSASFGDLLKSLEAQSEFVIDSEHQSLYSNPRGSFIDVVSPAKRSGIHFESDLPDNWEKFEGLVGKDATYFKSDMTSDVDFFEEYMMLQELVKSTVEKVIAGKATMFVHLVSLEGLHRKYGVSSHQYKAAAKLFTQSLQEVSHKLSGYPCVMTIIPPSTRLAKKAFIDSCFVPSIKARSAAKESPFALPSVASVSQAAEDTPSPDHPVAPPFQSGHPIAACFTAELACQRATNNCSGRGTCFKSAVEYQCWSCSCLVTSELVDIPSGKKGNKTTHWGGSACQKKDISTPFWLFTGFGIAIIIILFSIVGMMMSMGNEELPGALSAGVSYKRT